MSDLLEPKFSLSDYMITNRTPELIEEESALSKYIDSASNPIPYDPLNYDDPELKKYMHTPGVTNKLQIAKDFDKTAAEIATSYIMAQKLGLKISDILENYDQYSRHFFGDPSPVSNWQHVKDAFTEGKYGTKMGLLATEYIKQDFTPENEEQFLKKLALLEARMPPAYDDKGNVLMKAATGGAAQIYRQVKSAEYLSPIPDIERRLREVEEDPEMQSTAMGLLRGMNDYITGYDTDKDRTAYVTKWQATLGSFASGQGITLANSLYYSELETGNTYLALSKIKTPDTIGANGEVIPGVGLDENIKRALAKIAGPIKGLSEAYLEKYALAKIPGLKKLFGTQDFLTNVITDSAIKLGVKGALLKALQSAGVMEIGEIATEIFQGSVDISANNLAIALSKNKELLKTDEIGIKEALKIGTETFVETFWTTAPAAFFGGGYTGLIDLSNQSAYTKQELSEIVSDAISLTIDSERGFSTKDVQEIIRNDPRMKKYSDKVVEKRARSEQSKAEIREATGMIIDADIEYDKDTFLAQKEIDMRNDFILKNQKLIEGTEEFNKLFEQFKKDNHAEYFTTERALDDEKLRELYEKEHLIKPEPTVETVMVEELDVNGDVIYDASGKPSIVQNYVTVQGDSYYDMSYSDFVRQRREANAYSQSWVKTPEGQKYLATMSPAIDVISRVLDEELTPGTRKLLEQQQTRITNIVEEAQRGSHVVTMADLKTQTNLEVRVLTDKISQLQDLGRENRSDKVVHQEINLQLKELIRTKKEVESIYTQANHILEAVTRELFNMNRIKSSLENIHSRLSKYLEEYNSEEWQAFYKNLDTNTKAEDLIKTLFRDEYNLGIDENNELVKDPELENVLDDIFGKTHEGYKTLNKALQKIVRETSDTAQVRKDLENFQKMLINKMQRALSNYLKLNGDKYMESIMGDIGGNVSQPAADKIKAIQESIRKVDSAVSYQDILNAEEYVNEKLFPKDKEGQTTPYGRSVYDIASSRVSDILMRELKITYDANATAIRPKMSLEQLIQLKTEIDLMKYLGKLELAALQEDNFITTEILKSEFLSYQKSITDRSDKKSNPFKTAKFQVMMAAHWSKKLFGEKGYKFFWGDKLQADSEAKSQMNRRADEITNKTGLNKKEIAHAMFQKKEFNGKEYTVQQLMFYYLAKEFKDQDVWMALTANNGNRIDKELIGDFGATTAGVDGLLSDTEKIIAIAMQDDLESAWNRVAATYERATGARLGKIVGYLPLQVLGGKYQNLEEDIYTTMLRGSDYSEKGVAKGMVFERTPTTEQSAKEINDGLWDVWQNYIHKQEHYIAHDEWVRRAKQFMDDSDIKGTIKENFDPSWEKGINKYINDIADPTALHGASAIDSFSRILRHNIAVSALAARPAIILRQIPSVIMYLSEAGISEFSQSVWEYNTSWYVKDRKLRNRVKDFVTERDPATIESDIGVEDMLSYRNPTSKAAEIKNKIDNIGMAGIKWTDLNMKATGWKAIYNKYKSSLGEEGAIRRAREFTALTQPSSDKTTLPELYRHSELMNMFMMFTQQPTKIYNYFAYDVVPNLDPLNKDANRMAGVYGLTAIMGMNAAIWALTQKRIPEDPEDLIAALTIGSVSTIPVAGKGIAAGIRGEEIYGGGDIVTETISGIFDIFDLESWQEAFGDSDKTLKKINSVQNSMSALGWPSAVIDDWIDTIVTEDKTNVILGGNRGEK